MQNNSVFRKCTQILGAKARAFNVQLSPSKFTIFNHGGGILVESYSVRSDLIAALDALAKGEKWNEANIFRDKITFHGDRTWSVTPPSEIKQSEFLISIPTETIDGDYRKDLDFVIAKSEETLLRAVRLRSPKSEIDSIIKTLQGLYADRKDETR